MVLLENTVPPPIPLVDGADPINTGTPTDEDFYDALEASLNVQLHSSSDPTKYPADAIAELKDARGTFADVGSRIGQVVTPEGSIVGAVVPASIRNGFTLGNALANDTFMMWPAGDAAAPAYWTLSGAGAAIARCGVGQADTVVVGNQDHFSAKLTYGSAPAVLTQDVWKAATWSRLFGAFNNRYLPVDSNNQGIPGYSIDEQTIFAYAIGHVSASAADKARIAIYDGGDRVYSEYHPGTPGPPVFQTLIAGPMNPGSSQLSFECRMEQSGSAYFQCVGLIYTPLELPPMWIPAPVRYKTLTFYANNPAPGVLAYYTLARPAHILGAQMQCLTAGTVTAPTIDLLTPIAGVYSSLFTTLPTIATGQLVGAAQACDPAAANYRRLTIVPALAASATQLDNTSLQLAYTDDGGGTLRDLMVTIHYLEYDRPFDQFRAITDVG